MANPAPTINQINAFNATQGTTIDFNIIGGTELVRSNIIYIYDLSDNSLICTHLYASTESIHELPPNTDGSIVYESGKSSADFVNGAQYYAQIQTFTDIAGTQGGSGLSVAKMFWCLDDPTLTIDTIPSTISTTSYNVSATYNANTSVVSNIIQQYQFSLYSATGSLLQSSGVIVGSGEQQGTSTAYDISYNFTGLSVGSSYYTTVEVTTTQGMSVSAQSGTFTVSIDTPTLGEATVVNNACDGYISVTSNLSSEYGGSGSGDIVSFETDSENVFTKLQVTISPTQSGSGTPSPSNVRPIYGVGGVDVDVVGKNLLDREAEENGYISATGVVTLDGGVSAHSLLIPVVVGDSYTFSGFVPQSSPNGNKRIHGYDSNGNWVQQLAYKNVTDNMSYSVTATIPNGIAFIKVSHLKAETNCQVEKGSTATTYEPYTESIVSQQFDVSLTPTSTDTDPYLFKAVGDIYGDRLEEDIVGGSVVWNQLVGGTTFENSATVNDITYTVDKTNKAITASGTATGDAEFSYEYPTNTCITAGHVYYMAQPNGASSSTYYMKTGETTFWSYKMIGKASSSSSSMQFRIIVKNGQTVNFTFRPQFFDLTAMFGSTIADYVYTLEQAAAGSGIAWLKSYGFFTKPYYEYDTGTLKSVTPTAHKTTGINQWDEEWELGTLSTATGANEANSMRIRSKNYIPVLPNTNYYFSGFNDGRIVFYDASKNFVSYVGTVFYNPVIPSPNNARYVRFSPAPAYGTTYKHDICININNPTINGKYFPYEEHTYPLGDVTLRGIPKLDANNNLYYDGDTYESDGTVTRKYGIVDLGTLTWDLSSSGYFTATVSDAKLPVDLLHAPSMICKYPTVTASDLVYNTGGKFDKTASISSSTGKLLIRDSTYSTAATFKTAMSGVYLVYELATPTTEQTEPFEQIQEVSKYGTLEYITTNDVPVGHNTTYYTRDVFGGYIDLVSGKLVVTHKMINFNGSEDWSKLGNGSASAYCMQIIVSDMAIAYGSDIITQSDKLQSISPNATWGNYSSFISTAPGYRRICAGISTITTVDAWKSWLAANQLNVIYKLETPLTYQLTPQQIQTLVGVNNVWSEQGNIELSYHIPITNLLVKRQDVDDVSGNWLTLYSQPIEQASDMDFTFIDFLNQYGKTYKYALVPLLTQTQSGVEVEVEGGYTVSDEVQSIFDGVFISDSTGSQKCKANVGYGNVNMNQSVGSITPIGSQYPIIVTNSNNRYHNGSISGMIVPDDYYYNGNLSRIDMVNKRNELEQFLTNKRAKIIKDWNSNIWLVMIMDNIDCSFDNNYGMGIVTFNANWLEVGDPTNQEDLQATGLVDVGGV